MMDTLIRAAKLGKQPLLLKRAGEPPHALSSAIEAIARIGDAATVPPPGPGHSLPAAPIRNDYEHAHGKAPDPMPGYTAAGAEVALDVSASTHTREEEVEPRISYEEYERRLGAELERMQQTAREEGYAQGLEQARQQVQSEYAGELEHLRELVQSARAALEQQLEGLMDIGTEIVYEAVTKIMGRAYPDQQGVVGVVREVIRHAKDRTRLVVRVHPDDQPVLAACAEELVTGLNVGQIEVLGDDRVALGGCLLETPAGNLDGRLEIQLQQLRDTLLGVRARHLDAAGEP